MKVVKTDSHHSMASSNDDTELPAVGDAHATRGCTYIRFVCFCVRMRVLSLVELMSLPLIVLRSCGMSCTHVFSRMSTATHDGSDK